MDADVDEMSHGQSIARNAKDARKNSFWLRGWMRRGLAAPMLNGVVEVDEDGPEDGGAEEKREDFAAGGGVEAPGGVGAVKVAETVFVGGARATLAGVAEVQALRGGVGRLDCVVGFHGWRPT